MDAILLRMKMFGLSEKDARDQKAATFIGRLNLTDKKALISNAQYDAAVEFLAVYDKYKRAISAPDGTKQSGGAGGGVETEDYARWCKRAIEAYMGPNRDGQGGVMGAIAAEQGLHRNRGANLYAALDYIVCRDEQHWHMVGDVRLALNALAHHFGLLGKTKKEPLAA
ncbi:hypothetical protein ACFOOL_14985 [Devosia honganensis]|uniref:Uncharacterized protein n=1 Tax=Devosia honganensis TaxID=1610527 RepID=A0ABV7X3B3_9HYPH